MWRLEEGKKQFQLYFTVNNQDDFFRVRACRYVLTAQVSVVITGRYAGYLMVSALDSGLGDPGLMPNWGHCVVCLDKTL